MKKGSKRQGVLEGERLDWWREARFGFFIHWGLYAIPAGIWKGREVPNIGEWIMRFAEIPLAEYAPLAGRFNPRKFNAAEWVRVAVESGARYLVFTAKHHDGFAMYHSRVSPYNVVDATPWKRDPVAELADECRKAGLRFCLYYSQSRDWEHPDAEGNWWDYPDHGKKDFQRYLEEKVKPQLRELLTSYGKISMIWFDTPCNIKREQVLELKSLVREIQPDCLVSGRIGHGLGDYQSMGDNQVPSGPVRGDWETPATMNDTWAFKKNDHNWKSAGTLVSLLAEVASKGSNYLLNVGPTAEGVIPRPSVNRMAAIGRWLEANGEAIYSSRANPFPVEFPWGWVTVGDKRLFLLFKEWPGGKFALHGLKSRVIGVRLLAGGERLPFRRADDPESGLHRLEISLPRRKPDSDIPVVALDLGGEPDVEEIPVQQPDGSITLSAWAARIERSPEAGARKKVVGRAHFNADDLSETGSLEIGRSGVTQNWLDTGEWLEWDFRVFKPGAYRVSVFSISGGVDSIPREQKSWLGGHLVAVDSDRQEVSGELKIDREIFRPRMKYQIEAATDLGEMTFAEAGARRLRLRALRINQAVPGDRYEPEGLIVSEIRLEPVAGR